MLTRHLRETNESYFRHLGFAMKFSWGCLVASFQACMHAILPFVWETAASRKIQSLTQVATRGRGVIYEVTLQVQPSIEEAFTEWLREHMSEMLDFEGFLQAHLFDLNGKARVSGVKNKAEKQNDRQEATFKKNMDKEGSDTAPEKHDDLSEWTTLVVHYHVSSYEQLENYFRNHAAAMRADGEKRFGESFRGSRRILHATS